MRLGLMAPEAHAAKDLVQLLIPAQECADLRTVAVAISYDDLGWLILAGFKL